MLFAATTDWTALGLQTLVLLGVIASGYFSLRSRQIDLQTKQIEAAKDLTEVKSNVVQIEKATNSMKDALVKATKDAGLLEGEKSGRAAQKAESNQAAVDAAPKEKVGVEEVKGAVRDVLAENIDIVKQDVKVVKEDVKEIKEKI